MYCTSLQMQQWREKLRPFLTCAVQVLSNWSYREKPKLYPSLSWAFWPIQNLWKPFRIYGKFFVAGRWMGVRVSGEQYSHPGCWPGDRWPTRWVAQLTALAIWVQISFVTPLILIKYSGMTLPMLNTSSNLGFLLKCLGGGGAQHPT